MNNMNLIKYILTYLPKDELLPKYLIINKKINNWLKDEWIALSNSSHMLTKKYFYNIKKFSPSSYVVKFTRFISYQRVGDYHEIEIIQLEVKACPIYPGHKVGVRYSLNNWVTYSEGMISWCFNEDGREVWRGAIWLSHNIGREIHFAVFGIDVNGKIYWDNNNGCNYIIPAREY
jgi:hypothetical protein